jgi:hypothetical protein
LNVGDRALSAADCILKAISRDTKFSKYHALNSKYNAKLSKEGLNFEFMCGLARRIGRNACDRRANWEASTRAENRPNQLSADPRREQP